MESSKKLAQKAHQILKDLGHSVPQGHVYELFSKLSGHNSWNVAKTKDGFSPVIRIMGLQTVELSNESNYEVKITNDSGDFGGIELKKYYKVQADSVEEAEKIISDYIAFRSGEDIVASEAVKILCDLETEEEYLFKNWEVIWNKSTPKVQSTTPLLPIDELNLKMFFGEITKEEFQSQLKAKIR